MAEASTQGGVSAGQLEAQPFPVYIPNIVYCFHILQMAEASTPRGRAQHQGNRPFPVYSPNMVCGLHFLQMAEASTPPCDTSQIAEFAQFLLMAEASTQLGGETGPRLGGPAFATACIPNMCRTMSFSIKMAGICPKEIRMETKKAKNTKLVSPRW